MKQKTVDMCKYDVCKPDRGYCECEKIDLEEMIAIMEIDLQNDQDYGYD